MINGYILFIRLWFVECLGRTPGIHQSQQHPDKYNIFIDHPVTLVL